MTERTRTPLPKGPQVPKAARTNPAQSHLVGSAHEGVRVPRAVDDALKQGTMLGEITMRLGRPEGLSALWAYASASASSRLAPTLRITRPNTRASCAPRPSIMSLTTSACSRTPFLSTARPLRVR